MDLSGQTFVLLGATSAMGPFHFLKSLGKCNPNCDSHECLKQRFVSACLALMYKSQILSDGANDFGRRAYYSGGY